MKLNEVDIGSVNAAEYNPRKDLQPGDADYEKLKRSIQEFGYVEPIVVNTVGMVVIAGHQRLKVLKGLGFAKIDVITVTIEDKNKEKLLNIALNKIEGEWDYDKLEAIFENLSEFDDLDLTVSGFSENELYALLSDTGENFSFTPDPTTEGDDDTPDDFQDVKGESEGNGYVVQVTFDNEEDAIAFLEKIGVEDTKFKGFTKVVYPDAMDF